MTGYDVQGTSPDVSVVSPIPFAAKDYNRGFGIIRHNSPKVAANDLYTYESKLFLRTIDNF